MKNKRQLGFLLTKLKIEKKLKNLVNQNRCRKQLHHILNEIEKHIHCTGNLKNLIWNKFFLNQNFNKLINNGMLSLKDQLRYLDFRLSKANDKDCKYYMHHL